MRLHYRNRRRDDDITGVIHGRRGKYGDDYAAVEYEGDRSRPRARRKVYREYESDDEDESPRYRDNRASRLPERVSRLPDSRHWRGSGFDQRFKRTVIEVPSKQQWQEWLEDTWGTSMASKSRALQQHALQFALDPNNTQPSGGFYRSSSGIVPQGQRSSLYMDNEFTYPVPYRNFGYQRNLERSNWRRDGYARQPYVQRWKQQRPNRGYGGYYGGHNRGFYRGYYRGYNHGNRPGNRGYYRRNRKPMDRHQLDRQLEEYMGISTVKAQLDRQLESYMQDVKASLRD
eukprot:GEMP01021876.1.p1 GENE.GEMP01021876.1~~GEMP01021876.1.p1  ORF type:complete len:287 (+),score=46.84 GEMP01021876.1:131-991(+)